jgi:ElaB/YqjD/DUF883 family membrane-anchored ribosome-binding protein
MGETTDAIKGQIDQQRQQLEDNLEGIEGKFKETSDQMQQKVKDATDWRHQFNERPMLGLGIAFGGGMLVASMMGGGGSKSSGSSHSYPQPQYQSYGSDSHSGTDIGRQHVSSTIDNIKGALMGVAAAQAKSFLEQSVPSFNDEYRKVESENRSGGGQTQGSDGTPQSTSYPVHASDREVIARDQ